jgi:CRP-like cAMP-binding protein
MDNLERYIREHEFFEDLSEAHMDLLLECARQETCEADGLIFSEGEAADHFYVIRNGKVEVDIAAPDGEKLVVQTLSGGDILGWSWLLYPYVWTFDARAVEDTQLLAFDGSALRRKTEADPEFGYDFLVRFVEVMVRRLRSTRVQMLDLHMRAGRGDAVS